eukprot:bmy_16881T0
MSQQHSDSSLEEELLEYRFHSELQLDTKGNPASGLPMVRGSLQSRSNAAFQPDSPVPPSPSPEAQELRTIVLSTQSPAALKMGTQQLIPRSLAVSSKAKTPARHQSFGAAMLSKEAARRDPRLLSAPSFSLDDMDVDTGPGGMLRRNLRNQSYRAAMKGLGTPGGEGGPVQLSPKIPALAEEPSQPPARSAAKNKKTLGRKRAHKGSFKDDPRFYQEIQERGLNTSHESDDDLLDESSSPDGTRKVDAHIVVKSYRPPQVTWSQLPEVVESGILDKLPAEEHKRQEAIFEILTSEYSYQHSLGILVAEFLQSPELRATMTQTEHHHLFSNITDVLSASRRSGPGPARRPGTRRRRLSRLVKQCNEGAHKMERTEQMYTLHTQLDFSKVKPREAWAPRSQRQGSVPVAAHPGHPPGLIPVPALPQSLPLISASRWLLKRGELFVVEETGLFRKLASRPTCYLFLFNDVLVVTKKKSEDSFVVQDYAQLDHIQVQKIEASEASLPGGGNRSSFVPYAFQLTLLHNSEGRQGKILLSSDSASDRARWITALTHWERQRLGPTNKGDLLQVEITKAYLAKQVDEITLQQADVVLILEQEDGWFYGERLRDGETGWFPEDLARSITSRVAVEGNMRRMERLRVETGV